MARSERPPLLAARVSRAIPCPGAAWRRLRHLPEASRFQRIYLVADQRGLLELEPVGGLPHLVLEFGDHRRYVAGILRDRGLVAPGRRVGGLQARLGAALHAAGDDPVLLVVRDLPLAAGVRDLDRPGDRARYVVGVEDHPALLVPRRAPRGLYEARLAPQEP